MFATVGPFVQYGQEPARQVAEQNKVPMVGNGPATLDQLKGTQYQWSVMTAAAPPPQADAVDKVIKASGWKNVLGLADVLNIDQETLDLVGQAAAAGGYKFTKMPDTFGFDQQDFQPILNKMMEQINTLKPDAIILYVNPIAFPVIYKGLRGLNVTLPILAGTACAHPAIFARARRRSTGSTSWIPAATSTRPRCRIAGPARRCSSTSLSATRPSTTRPPTSSPPTAPTR